MIPSPASYRRGRRVTVVNYYVFREVLMANVYHSVNANSKDTVLYTNPNPGML
jgi:hypothetical protein